MDDICNQTENKRDVLLRVGLIGTLRRAQQTGMQSMHATTNNHYAINTMLNDYRTHLVVYLLDPLNVVDREIKM